MTKHRRVSENTHRKISRRSALATGGVCFAMLGQKTFATMTATNAAPVNPTAIFTKERELDGMVEIDGIHQGKGKGKAKLFRFNGAPWPAHFMIYDLPPGASEGVHTHFLDDRNGEGAFDEYYYIISGEGQMEVGSVIVPVAKGDHIHTPLEVAHGIENTHPTNDLRVFLTFIEREQ